MDLNYLVNEILPQREKEIRRGDNAATAQPVYVVLDLKVAYCSGHSEYSPSTNHIGLGWEHGYFKELEDEREFVLTDSRKGDREKATRFYIDNFVAFFLTRRSAEDYLRYQKHNLSRPYIYVFYSGYGNREMNALLNNER